MKLPHDNGVSGSVGGRGWKQGETDEKPVAALTASSLEGLAAADLSPVSLLPLNCFLAGPSLYLLGFSRIRTSLS